MPCIPISFPGGTAIACTRGKRGKKCHYCKRASERQCDGKIGEGKTCDRHLCSLHAHPVAKEKDLCPHHFDQWNDRLIARGLVPLALGRAVWNAS